MLLALAVTATIVLAAFQATKDGNVTITFGSGLTLEVTGGTGLTGGDSAEFSVSNSNLTNFGTAIADVSAVPDQKAYIAFEVTVPSASSAGGYTLGTAEVNAGSRTITYDIKNSKSQHVANLVITFGTDFQPVQTGVDTYDTILYTNELVTDTTAGTVMFNISITGEGSYTVDAIAGLSFEENITVKVGATTADSEVTSALQAVKLIDSNIGSLTAA